MSLAFIEIEAQDEHLGPLPGDPIMVCPNCGEKAWSLCHACGWEQWTPPDDPDRIRAEEGNDDYGRLIDANWLTDWPGLLLNRGEP